jgi:hypothetical protein
MAGGGLWQSGLARSPKQSQISLEPAAIWRMHSRIIVSEVPALRYTRGARYCGISKNSALRLIDQTMNGIDLSTSAPMWFSSSLGFNIAIARLYAAVALALGMYIHGAPCGTHMIIVTLIFPTSD